MCKHCEKLVEDKEVVHRFFEVGAARLNEMLPKRLGMPLHRPVTADDIESPTLKVNATFWRRNPNDYAHQQAVQMFDEMDDDGYYKRMAAERENERVLEAMKNPVTLQGISRTKRLEAMLSEMANLPHPDEKK